MSGLDRGRPVDRYYIENFLQKYENDIRGNVAEIMDSSYTRQFGGSRVTGFHVLDIDAKNPQATMICNLESGEGLPTNAFDCFVITQTYSSIYDVKEAIRNSYRILKPGGVLLATVPGIAKILRFALEDYGEYWRFTTMSARRLFEEVFPADNVTVEAGGNVFTTAAFLYGMVVEEMSQEELEYNDRDYELIITVRAVKPGSPD
jgi:SAM-dependent methyltransferase